MSECLTQYNHFRQGSRSPRGKTLVTACTAHKTVEQLAACAIEGHPHNPAQGRSPCITPARETEAHEEAHTEAHAARADCSE